MNWYKYCTQTIDEDSLGMKREFAGFLINIENPAGTIRMGTDKKGKEWRIDMQYDYGFINRVKGEDGEGLDVYLGANEDAKNVYIVRQVVPDTGEYDEDKIMLGFDSEKEAKEAYLLHYSSEDFFGSMDTVTMSKFKKCIENDDLGDFAWKKKAQNKSIIKTASLIDRIQVCSYSGGTLTILLGDKKYQYSGIPGSYLGPEINRWKTWKNKRLAGQKVSNLIKNLAQYLVNTPEKEQQMRLFASSKNNRYSVICYGCNRNIHVDGSEWMKKRSSPSLWRCDMCKKIETPKLIRDRSVASEFMLRMQGNRR